MTGATERLVVTQYRRCVTNRWTDRRIYSVYAIHSTTT